MDETATGSANFWSGKAVAVGALGLALVGSVVISSARATDSESEGPEAPASVAA